MNESWFDALAIVTIISVLVILLGGPLGIAVYFNNGWLTNLYFITVPVLYKLHRIVDEIDCYK